MIRLSRTDKYHLTMIALRLSRYRLPVLVSTLVALTAATLPVHAWNSSKVQYDVNGRLYYPEDAGANRIPDYSHAGYKGGGVPLPQVPVVLTLSPVDGDDTASIQAGLNAVGALPVQADGYRGTLLLTAGAYQVDGTLRINQSGVVLAGVGDGEDPATNTVLYRTNTSTATVIIAGGNTNDQFRSEIAGTRRPITTQRVSVGSRAFNVDDASGFVVGDNIIIHHPSTAAWIDAMDNGGVTDANIWKPGEIDIRYHRYITAISGNTIMVDAPVYNHLDRGLSQSSIYKYNNSGILRNMGIEDLRIDIATNGPTSEDHANDAIEFAGAEDSWIRDCTMNHFVHAGVQFSRATRCTAERVNAIDPHSVITGSRRYNFSTYHAQLILFRECYASEARHAFVMNGTSNDSGIVALNSIVERSRTYAEAHRRWSTGILFDGLVAINRVSNDVFGFYNRGNYGTGHGWAAGHSVIWRTDAGTGGKILVQQPPTAQNYAIGSFGNITGSGPFAGPAGFREGNNTPGLEPQSLYLEQLNQRQTSVAPLDLQAPTAPVATSGGSTPVSAIVNWIASADNVGVAGYDVFAGSTYAGTTTDTTFTVTGLASGTAYVFTVQARDVAGNTTLSNAVNITTQGAPPAPVKPSIVFEAENLSYVATGAGTSVSTETNPSPSNSQVYASNFQYVNLSANNDPLPPPAGSGEYVEFTLPNIPAGSYNLKFRYKSHPSNRGRMTLSVDGIQVGGTINQRSSPATFLEVDLGVVKFATAGNHIIRITSAGRDATATQYTVNADVFTLVPDNTAPVIAALPNLTREATSAEGAVVTYSGTATDNHDGSVPVSFTPPSGSTFPLGTNLVVALAEDSSGNIGVNSFNVTVVDTTPPTLNLPASITAEATSPAGAPVTFNVSATDLVASDVGVSVSHEPGSIFPLGSTTVTATAQDDFDNIATGDFTVTVVDSTAPAITRLAASPNVLTPPNHQLVPVTIAVTASDAVDTTPIARILSVTSNEPDNGLGDGDTVGDWEITGDLTLNLRAERSGTGTGRIYSILVEVRDDAGNASMGTVRVTVPKSAGKK
jgi:chitodextrinase